MASYRKNEAREWARENLRGVANVVIPSYTNDLKALNDRFGHARGDQALRETARVLRGELRAPDVCSRGVRLGSTPGDGALADRGHAGASRGTAASS